MARRSAGFSGTHAGEQVTRPSRAGACHKTHTGCVTNGRVPGRDQELQVTHLLPRLQQLRHVATQHRCTQVHARVHTAANKHTHTQARTVAHGARTSTRTHARSRSHRRAHGSTRVALGPAVRAPLLGPLPLLGLLLTPLLLLPLLLQLLKLLPLQLPLLNGGVAQVFGRVEGDLHEETALSGRPDACWTRTSPPSVPKDKAAPFPTQRSLLL